MIWFPERREQRPAGETHQQGAKEWMAEEEWEGAAPIGTEHLFLERESLMLRFPGVEVNYGWAVRLIAASSVSPDPD